jgi:sarcosine oxidase subunit beta
LRFARSGIKVTVLDKFIVGWEASGRNGGGGASHWRCSPLFDEEQRLWPQMDELPVPYRASKGRIPIAMTERQWSNIVSSPNDHQTV